MSSAKEKAKLAANVSKMIGALKMKATGSTTSPQDAPLAGAAAAAPRHSSAARSSSTGSSNAFRTPSRDRFSSPGSNSLGSEDELPFDSKSFNRSRGDSAERASQGSLLDLPDENVFAQGGFGLPPAAGARPAAAPAGGVVTKPQPRRDAPAAGAATGPDAREKRERTPRKRDSGDASHATGTEHRRSSDPARDRETPADSRRTGEQRSKPRREERYSVDELHEAEVPRKQQLHDGRDGRRSAPRDSSNSATPVNDGRSRSGQRRLQDAAKRAVETGGGASKPQAHSRRTPEATPSQDYILPQAVRKQSPPQPKPGAAPAGVGAAFGSVESTPLTTKPLLPPVERTTPLSNAFPVPPSLSATLGVSTDPSAVAAASTSASLPRQTSPAIGIRRKASGPSASASSPTGAGGAGIGMAGGVAKAIATMSQSTTRALLGGSTGKSHGATAPPRDVSPDTIRGQQPSQASQAFSLADFVRETSSQYDFNRAPSRLSVASSNDGVSTPVQMRGSNLLDSISDQKFPAKPIPNTTAGVLDSSWLDATSKSTTSAGLEKTELQVRLRVQHAALFRPKVWFLNNVLPQMRQDMLKSFALRKRKLFVECAEPNFREKVVVQYHAGLAVVRCQREEDIDRLELERASMLWRTQVKGAFDRLVQQLRVELQRKVEAVRQSVEQDIQQGANALVEKTSFSYLHLHGQFGDGLLRRTKELYIYYFGIMASMNLKEEKERAFLASEQRFGRLQIEMDRIRFFIMHLELVEYENIMKYFAGEKRILESELRFKPKTTTSTQRNSTLPALPGQSAANAFSLRQAAAAAIQPSATPVGGYSADPGRATPATSSTYPSASPTPMSFARERVSATPLHRDDKESSFHEKRKETQSPFPLEALERVQQYRRGQVQQQQQSDWQARELAGTPAAGWAQQPSQLGGGRTASLARNPNEGFMQSQSVVASSPAMAQAPQHQHPGSYQQSNPMAHLMSFQQQQQQAALQAALERQPPPVTQLAAAGATALNRGGSFGGGEERLSKQLQWEEANFTSTAVPLGYSRAGNSQASRVDYRKPSTGVPRVVDAQLGVEEKRRSDEEDLPLPTAPIRGGHLLPKIDPQARKSRENTEGVVNGLMLVSNVMGGAGAPSSSSSRRGREDDSDDAGGYRPAGTPTISASAMGGRLLPPILPSASPAAIASMSNAQTQNVVSTIGRMLLGSSAISTTENLLGVPDSAIDDRRVHLAELDTAVALLLLLHKNGSDTIQNDELQVRRSLVFYEAEDRKDAIQRAAQARQGKFYSVRQEKVVVEEQELRLELINAQRHEFGLHVQRQQWVEYFFLTTEEASERERIVGMSHLSLAIVSKHAKQEFSLTCLMQHQVVAMQQQNLYERWFLSEVLYPTSLGLKVEQNERRERNKILFQMDKEYRLLSQDARERRVTRELYSRTPAVNPVEVEAITSVEDVHRRQIARQYADSWQRFLLETWDEPMARAVVAIARERWFRDLVRPSQHRVTIHIQETSQREAVARQESVERTSLLRVAFFGEYEARYQEVFSTEQREFRRISMNHLKERRQRELRERESASKKESMARYIQGAVVGSVASSPSKNAFFLGDSVSRYVTATADGSGVPRSSSSTPVPDYSVMLRAKQLHQQQSAAK